jgi:hypothetical protein
MSSIKREQFEEIKRGRESGGRSSERQYIWGGDRKLFRL